MPAPFVDNLLPAITWTLVHSLWQGLILTVLAGLVMLFTRRSTAALRYAILCSLFFLFLGGVCATFFIEWNEEITPIVRNSGITEQIDSTPIFPINQLQKYITSLLDQNAQWIVLAWTIVLLFQACRIVRDRMFIRELRSKKVWPTDALWNEKLQVLAEELRIRKTVVLLESAVIKIPIVFGYFKPIVMIPIGMLNHLKPGEVEAVLLHELAHIRRHDYLVNYLQRIAETLLFFNPGLLWVSSLLRAEREVCCDEIAIARTGNKLQFVEALIRCKEQAMHSPAFSLGLLGNKNLLLQRMNRIVSNRNKAMSFFEASFFVISILVLTFIVAGWKEQTAESITITPTPFVEQIQPVRKIVTQQLANESKKVKSSIPATAKFGGSRLSSKPLKQIKKQPVREVVSNIVEGDGSIAELTNEPIEDMALHLDQQPPTQQTSSRMEFDQRRASADWHRMQIEKAHELMQIDHKKAELRRVQAERERELAKQHRLVAEKERLRANKERIEIQKLREENDRLRQPLIVQ